MRFTGEPEPGRGAAAFLAILMHVLFLGLLVFGLSWQSRYPQVTTVDLWSNLPAPPRPVVLAQPPHEIEAAPPPKPQVKPEPVPEAKPEAKPEPKPEPINPDILLRQKAEKEKAEKEKAEKEEAEKLKLEQQKIAENKRKIEAEQQSFVKEQLAKEDEALQLQRDKENAIQQLQADQQAAQSRLIADYINKIQAKIRSYVVVPPDMKGNPQAVYKVVLLPDGEVLSAQMEKSSGFPAYDNSIERAIYNAQPLPLPSDPTQFPNFRVLDLRFRPND